MGESYDVQDAAALSVVAGTETEADDLDRQFSRLAGAVDAAAAVAGGPVGAALAELRGRGEEVARGERELVARAAAAARTAIAAYTGADGDMADQYGPFPVLDPRDVFRGAPSPPDPLDPFGLLPPP
jgi:hypothetical protein